jgi:hypothetical protein
VAVLRKEKIEEIARFAIPMRFAHICLKARDP